MATENTKKAYCLKDERNGKIKIHIWIQISPKYVSICNEFGLQLDDPINDFVEQWTQNKGLGRWIATEPSRTQ